MALLERLQIVIEADARTAEREFDRIGRQATESLESIEDAAGRVGDNASAELAGASSKFARAGQQLSDAAASELDLSAAAREAAADVPRALDSSRQEAEVAGRRLGESAGGGVVDGVRQSGSRVRGAGADLGDQAGEGVSDGLLGSLAGIGGDLSGAMDDALASLPAGLAGPVAAAGALIGAGLVNGISDAIETENLGDVIAARVGEGAAESERFARVTSQVFRDAWGESTAQVADAVDAVYSTLSDARGSEAALERLTKKAQAMADVFAIDVQQAVAAAGQVVFNGLADDADEAFDLIIAGMQNVSSTTRDELLDALAEYSDDFGNIGIDGKRAMDILASAAEGGTFGIDKAGDSVKELAIRVADLNDTAAQRTLAELGLDAQQLATDMAAGGEAADKATQDIARALLAVEDPAEQYTLALTLMGAPYEDLGRRLGPDFIRAMAGSGDAMRDAKGASDEFVESLNNTSSAFTTVKRELLGGFEDGAEELLAPLADALSQPDPSLSDFAEALGRGLMEDVRDGVEDQMGAGDIPLMFEDLLRNVPGIDWDAVFGDPTEEANEAGTEAGLVIGEAIRTAAQEAQAGGASTGFGLDGIDWQIDPDTGEWAMPDVDVEIGVTADTTAASDAIGTLSAEIEEFAGMADIAAQRTDQYLSRIAGLSNVDDAISAQLSLRDAFEGVSESVGALAGVDVQGFADGVVDIGDEAAAALGDVASAGAVAQEQIANVLQTQGDVAAIEKAAELREEFIGIFEAAGLSDGQINTLLESMGLLPEQVTTAIELSGTDMAIAQLELLRSFLNDENGEGIPAEVNTILSAKIAEGDLVGAAGVLATWVQDQEDGSIDDPLLIAMGLGDTKPASNQVDVWKANEQGKPPVRISVDADVAAARAKAQGLAIDISQLNPSIVVAVRTKIDTTGSGVPYSIPYLEAATGRDINDNGIVGRAMGGPMLEGATYEVNERGQELFVSNDGGFMVNASNLRQLMNNMEQLARSGGSTGGGDVINIYETAGPRQTAEEVIRTRNANRFLSGASL